MMTQHLSEAEIQEYVLDKDGCPSSVTSHIRVCETCRASAAAYQSLFTGISQEPSPAFDFDLTSLVMPQLPVTPPKPSPYRFLMYLLIPALGIAAGIPLYLFKGELIAIFASVLPMSLYLILLIALSIGIFQCVDMYKRYLKQIHHINTVK
jgi:hypothetical protein